MAQARGYDHCAAPAVVLREPGGDALVVLELAVFARVAGIDPCVLPTRHRVTRRPSKQLEMFASGGA